MDAIQQLLPHASTNPPPEPCSQRGRKVNQIIGSLHHHTPAQHSLPHWEVKKVQLKWPQLQQLHCIPSPPLLTPSVGPFCSLPKTPGNTGFAKRVLRYPQPFNSTVRSKNASVFYSISSPSRCIIANVIHERSRSSTVRGCWGGKRVTHEHGGGCISKPALWHCQVGANKGA